MPSTALPSVQPKPSDTVLLARFADGERIVLDELFQRYRTVAYRVAYRLLGNEADALDAVQDGFVKALSHLTRFGGRSSFKTWLLRVICNAALDIGRNRKRGTRRQTNSCIQSIEDSIPIDAGLHREDIRRVIEAALARLPETQRQTFVLHVEGELSYREVADALGISIGTVMSRLHYARQRLKELLANHQP